MNNSMRRCVTGTLQQPILERIIGAGRPEFAWSGTGFSRLPSGSGPRLEARGAGIESHTAFHSIRDRSPHRAALRAAGPPWSQNLPPEPGWPMWRRLLRSRLALRASWQGPWLDPVNAATTAPFPLPRKRC